MKKSTIIYGLLAGLFVTLVMDIGMATIYDTDSEGSMLFGYTTMLVAFSLIFVNISPYWLRAVQGILILLTVLADLMRRRRRAVRG